MSAVGQVLAPEEKTLALDDEDRKNLEDGLAKIEKARRGFSDSISEVELDAAQ